MNTKNNSMGIKVRNDNVGKAECSVVLTPQNDSDETLLNRLMSEEITIEPVTLTDYLEELDGHEVSLRPGYRRGVRLAVRPKVKPQVAKSTKATKKPVKAD